MTLKKLFILSFIFLLSLGKTFSQNDSLILKSVSLCPDTLINGVRGIGLTYYASLCYDTIFHLRKRPTTLQLVISLNANNTPVKCENSFSKYCKNGAFNYKKDLLLDLNTRKTVLIPFYILKLPQGQNNVSLSLSAVMSDTSIFESALKNIKIIGEKSHRLTFVKPPLERFNVLVSGAKLMTTDFKGKPWDYNFFSGSAPDICWKVTIGRGDCYNTLYKSAVTKNSYSAAWLDGTYDITISMGDEFCVGVYDDDPMSDDLAGSVCGKLSNIIKFSTQKQPMSFDRLSYFAFIINRVAP